MADGTGQLAITNMALEELTTQLKDRRPPEVFFSRALEMELSTPGFSNSRIRARTHVHTRSPGSRPSLWRGLNEEFHKKKLKTKKLRRLED